MSIGGCSIRGAINWNRAEAGEGPSPNSREATLRKEVSQGGF